MNQKSINIENNPLLGNFNTPHETAPFTEIKIEHFLPAFKEAIKKGEADVKAIIENKENPAFENTIAALDRAGFLLGRTSGIFFNLLSAETNDEIQKIAQEVSPLLTKFQNDVTLNPDLFEKVKTVHNRKDELNLTIEQQTLLENTYINFIRKGAGLSGGPPEGNHGIYKDHQRPVVRPGHRGGTLPESDH